MEISLNVVKKIAKKFWWVVAAATLLGLIVGFVFGSTRVSTTYTATAQLIVDVEYLESIYGGEGSNSPSFSAGYNTAHSLVPTYEKTLFNEETVLSRVADTYYEETGIVYTPEELRKKFGFSFTTNTLVIDLSCTSSSEDECVHLLTLLCEHGIQRLNLVSSAVKLKIAEVQVFSYTFTLENATVTEIENYKNRIENKNDEIYDYVMSYLPVGSYLQRDEIRNGFKFAEKANGELTVTYSNSNSEVTKLVSEHVTKDEYIGNLVYNGTFADKPDVEYFKEISDGVAKTSSRTMFYTVVVGVLAAICGAAAAYVLYYINNKKKPEPVEAGEVAEDIQEDVAE